MGATAGAFVAASALLTGIGGAAAATTPPSNTSRPAISGTAREGQTLTASNGTWTGTTPLAFAYQWQRCDTQGADCHAIAAATGQSYRLVAADVGHALRVNVSASNSAGSASATSDATAKVASGPPQNTAAPAITGAFVEGSTLRADRGSWTSSTRVTFAYAWQRCSAQGTDCVPLPKATDTRYVLQTDDVGHTMRLSVTATNTAGSTSAVSNPTPAIAPRGTAPVNTAAPSISGDARATQKLTLASGSWSGASPIAFSYQWQRCDATGNTCSNLDSHGQSYTVTPDDIGLRLRGVVTAKNSLGSSTAVSAPTALVTSASGTNAIEVTNVSLPDRLVVDQLSFSPAVLRSRDPFIVKFHVAESRGLSVSGALVYLVGVPFGRITNAPETPTGPDGWATIQLVPTKKLPLVRGGSLVLFVRARKPGDNVLAGVSTRRLVQVRTAAP